MLKNKQRKEVSLDAETIAILTQQAEKQGRKLKNYMEHVLKQQANDSELSDEYKHYDGRYARKTCEGRTELRILE
ncbi:hypothetical protein N9811_02375 [Bacteroidia bacterium]|jgi:hypothetical protein|nr:hypothetical protein [Bacteroidota bacterium]MDB4173632.1 hypothetical protein [Bacteroidia bacterium]